MSEEIALAVSDRLEGIVKTRPAAWAVERNGSGWATEPDVGRVAYGVPARVDRLKGLGNAVVPQCAEFVGRAIVAHAKVYL